MWSVLKQYLPSRPPTRRELGWILLPVVVAFVLLTFDRYGVEHRFWAMYAADFTNQGIADNQNSIICANVAVGRLFCTHGSRTNNLRLGVSPT